MKKAVASLITTGAAIGVACLVLAQLPKNPADVESWSNPADWFNGILWDPGPPSIGEIGQLKEGRFEEVEGPPAWLANSEADVTDCHPSNYLYGQITRPKSESATGPPAHLHARIQSFRADGSPVSPGVSARFVLVSSDLGSHVYRTAKPIIFIQNTHVEGDWPGIIAITGDDGCWARIVAE